MDELQELLVYLRFQRDLARARLSLSPTGALSFVAALIGMAAAAFVLPGAAEAAVRLVPARWYVGAHDLVLAAGLAAAACLLGCVGLGLALLCVACATATPTLAGATGVPVLDSACSGLAVFLGCGVSGWLLAWAGAALLAWAGPCALGLAFSLVLLLLSHAQVAEAPSRMLVLPTAALLTMYLGIWSGAVIDVDQIRVCSLHLLLVPAACLTGFLAPTLLRRNRGEGLALGFTLLLPLWGLVFGVGALRPYWGAPPLFARTFYTLKSLVYATEILTGVLGMLGGVCLSLWAPHRAGGLAFWVAVPAAVSLYLLDQDADLLVQQGAAAGGLLGMATGVAAASGVALGLAVMSAGYVLCPLVLGVAATARARREDRDVLVNAVVTFAVLGVVMMGAAVLGVAGFLTASLGWAGLYGTALAGAAAVGKGFYLLSVWVSLPQ